MQRVGRDCQGARRRDRVGARPLDRSLVRSLLLAAGLAAAVALLGACSGGGGSDGEASDRSEALADEGTGGPATAPIRDAVTASGGATVALQLPGPHLAVVVDQGGRCEAGTCLRVLEFAADGSWLLTDTDGEMTEGGFDALVLADLARNSSAAEIDLGPFAGECPTAFDGNERSYLVYSPDEPAETVLDLASCRDQIDANAPIMVALDLLALEASR